METLPPTYENATSRDYWSLIAPYIPSHDLCSCSLVSRRWHEVYVRELWGNPASHFGVGEDAIYVALVRFKRTLPRARLWVRELTHTLHLPPAHPELYEGPRSDWLRDVLDQLPRLQALIVQGLPFFDHGALLTLRYIRGASPISGEFALFNLRYLDASHCGNATPGGLVEALRHFPALLYLNLSGVQAVRVPSVLTSISKLPGLQILKLRGLGLRDSDINIIARLGRTLRSLDVTDNALTDASARILLDQCFKRARIRSVSSASRPSTLAPTRSIPEELEDFLGLYAGTELEVRVRKRLTTGLVDNLAIELDVEPGLTHLYISENKLTVEGVAALLKSGRLQVLDCGDVAPGHLHHDTLIELPGVSKLIPLINDSASPDLSYLRINYAVATSEYQAPPEKSTRAELPGDFVPIEPVKTQTPELEGSFVNTTEPHNLGFVAELEGSPVTPETSRIPLRPSPNLQRQASDFAPQPTWTLLHEPMATSPIITNAVAGHGRPGLTISSPPTAAQGSSLARDTPIVPPLKLSPPHSLKTLHLTGLPSLTTNRSEVNNLIDVIYSCASSTQQASLRAASAYNLSPGMSATGTAIARRRYARSLFPLEKIILEVYHPRPKVKSAWRRVSHFGAMEDADVDAFWQSASRDFSFFDEDEECGQPKAGQTGDARPSSQFGHGPYSAHTQQSPQQPPPSSATSGIRPVDNGRRSSATIQTRPPSQMQVIAPPPVLSRSEPVRTPLQNTMSPLFNRIAVSPEDKFIVNRESSVSTYLENPISPEDKFAVIETPEDTQPGLEVTISQPLPTRPKRSLTVDSSASRYTAPQESEQSWREQGNAPRSISPIVEQEKPAPVPSPHIVTQQNVPEHKNQYDFVAELSAFRKEKKAAHLAAVSAAAVSMNSREALGNASGQDSLADVYVPGYWPGEIQVIRCRPL